MEFKVGDIIQLKSGGPIMTVTGSAPDMQGTICVSCVWFVGASRDERRGVFPATAVTAIEAKKSA